MTCKLATRSPVPVAGRWRDIDIVTTPAGLQRSHDRFVGRGYVPRAQGLRKRLRDTVHRVDIDVICAGEHAGSEGSPVVYPPPESDAFATVDGGLRNASLESLIEFKIAAHGPGRRAGADQGATAR